MNRYQLALLPLSLSLLVLAVVRSQSDAETPRAAPDPVATSTQTPLPATPTATLTPTPEPTPTPTPEPPTPTPLPQPTGSQSTSAQGSASPSTQASGSLTYDELVNVLLTVGWPEGVVSEAVSVASCESGWRPSAVGDHGSSYGLFQLKELWFRYAGTSLSEWSDPYVNAYTALQTYYYDVNRGQPAWKQWTCKPRR